MHCILQAGSRSFSHFLNASERYRKLVEALARNASERRDVLVWIREFWKDSSQFRVMYIDKYLQYDLVQQGDVVAVILGAYSARPSDVPEDWPTIWTDFHAWELLSNVLNKSKGRLATTDRRILETEKEDERVRTQRNGPATTEAENMDVEMTDPDQTSKEMVFLQKRREDILADHSRLIVSLLAGFVKSLTPGIPVENSVTPSLLDQVIDGTLDNPLAWDTLARLGFYREFVRSVRCSLGNLDH